MRIVKTTFKYVLALAFVLAGANHFISTAFYLSIMPPLLPAHLFLVYLSGVCEIALGILLMIPKYSRLAAWGLITLMIAVFPANVYMAMNTNLFPQFDPTAIWLRLPLQFLLIAWAFWHTREELER
jgi:uncharacterized membrane protein